MSELQTIRRVTVLCLLWPSLTACLQMASTPDASVEAHLETLQATCSLTYKDLDTQQIIASVQDDGAGATAVFIGLSIFTSMSQLTNHQAQRATHSKVTSTRENKMTLTNISSGKTVTRLEYQAYSKIAMKTMSTIAANAIASASRSQHQPATSSVPPIIRCAIYHRLGTVPVGEPSIGIASRGSSDYFLDVVFHCSDCGVVAT